MTEVERMPIPRLVTRGSLRWIRGAAGLRLDVIIDLWVAQENRCSLTEHVQRSRLRVETRKWLLAKALPKDKFEPRARGEEEQDERNLFDRVKDMFG